MNYPRKMIVVTYAVAALTAFYTYRALALGRKPTSSSPTQERASTNPPSAAANSNYNGTGNPGSPNYSGVPIPPGTLANPSTPVKSSVNTVTNGTPHGTNSSMGTGGTQSSTTGNP